MKGNWWSIIWFPIHIYHRTIKNQLASSYIIIWHVSLTSDESFLNPLYVTIFNLPSFPIACPSFFIIIDLSFGVVEISIPPIGVVFLGIRVATPKFRSDIYSNSKSLFLATGILQNKISKSGIFCWNTKATNFQIKKSISKIMQKKINEHLFEQNQKINARKNWKITYKKYIKFCRYTKIAIENIKKNDRWGKGVGVGGKNLSTHSSSTVL